MTAQELYDQFRSDMVDMAEPYLWSDTDVIRYMNDAYRMFVRLTGGIADFTSDLSRVAISAGEATSPMDARILRVMEAYRLSDEAKIEVINQTNMTFSQSTDYGRTRPLFLDSTPGPVRYMIIGAQRNVAKWVQVPLVDDTAQLFVYRLPEVSLDPADPDMDFAFDEVGEEHHMHLCLWMQHLAYRKADADTFDRGRSDEYKALFESYCGLATAEWERYKHKNRETVYGGL